MGGDVWRPSASCLKLLQSLSWLIGPTKKSLRLFFEPVTVLSATNLAVTNHIWSLQVLPKTQASARFRSLTVLTSSRIRLMRCRVGSTSSTHTDRLRSSPTLLAVQYCWVRGPFGSNQAKKHPTKLERSLSEPGSSSSTAFASRKRFASWVSRNRRARKSAAPGGHYDFQTAPPPNNFNVLCEYRP